MKAATLTLIAVLALSFGLLAGCHASVEVDDPHVHVHSATCGHAYDNGVWIDVGHTHGHACGCVYVEGRWER